MVKFKPNNIFYIFSVFVSIIIVFSFILTGCEWTENPNEPKATETATEDVTESATEEPGESILPGETDAPVNSDEPTQTSTPENTPDITEKPEETVAPTATPTATPYEKEEETVALKTMKTDNTYIVIYDDECMDIVLTYSPENTTETFIWYSDDDSIATVNENGRVYGKSEGVTYIHCVATGGMEKTVKVTIKNSKAKQTPTPTPKPTATPTPKPTATPASESYINKNGNTLGTRFNAPSGYTKISVSEGSFGEFLRNYKLKSYGTVACYYNGNSNTNAPTYAVLDQTIPNWDIQQCADTVMRLWAEYLYYQGRYDEIYFNMYSSPVFKLDYVTWASGKRADCKDGKHYWFESESAVKDDYSEATFRKYLNYVYSYANTASLKSQLKKITADELTIGDVIVASNTDLTNANGRTFKLGHAVIVADVAVNSKGEKLYLIVEGTTPATQPYVVSSGSSEFGGIWVKLQNGVYVTASGVKFTSDCFRRF